MSLKVVEWNVPGKIHNRFHVHLLLPADENPLPSQIVEYNEPVTILDDEGEEEFFIDEVIGCGTRKEERQALVKWTNIAQPE